MKQLGPCQCGSLLLFFIAYYGLFFCILAENSLYRLSDHYFDQLKFVHQDVPIEMRVQDPLLIQNKTYQNQITPVTVHKTNKSIAVNSTVSAKTPVSPLMNDDNNNDNKYDKWIPKVDIEDTIQRMNKHKRANHTFSDALFTLLQNFTKYQKEHYNDTDAPFICYDPHIAGLGNKIGGLIGALSFSMITNRVFSICNWSGITNYFDFPFPFVKRSFSYRSNPDNFTILDYYGKPSIDLRVENTTDYFNKEKRIVIRTYGNFFELLYKNPIFTSHYENTLASMQKVHFNVPLLLSSFLLNHSSRPTKHLEDTINNFYKNHFINDYTIGVHLRTGHLPNKEEHHNLFNHFPHMKYLKRVYSICDALNSYNHTCNVFLVTDNSDLKASAKTYYPSLITYNASIGHSGVALLNDYSIEAADAIVELYLLAKCDKIFGTPGSTFSGLAERIGCFPIE